MTVSARFGIATALLLLTGAFPIHAQAPAGSISGLVNEAASGEAVIGATVALYRAGDTAAGSKASRGAITNRFGFYSIAGVAAGTYRLTVRYIGFATAEREVTVSERSPDPRVDIKLVAADITTREVVVQADRERTVPPISTVELRPGFMERLPALGGEVDLFRTLQLLPGVKSVSEISTGLYVRGGSPDQNLILLDGVIVYNPSHLGGFLSTFNSDAIQDIRLIKGAFPAEYGGRLSSVIDMSMREGTREKISGTAGVSLINSRLTLEGPIGEDATFMISGRRMYLDLLTALHPDSEELPSYYFYDLNAKVNYRLSDRDHVFLSGYFGRDVLGSPPKERDRFDIDWGNVTGNLRWMHIISPILFTNFSAIVTDYEFSTLVVDTHGDNGVQSQFKSVSGVRDFMLRGEAQYYAHRDHTIKTGIEATAHRFRADASAELADFLKIDRNPTIRNSFDAAVYLQDEWSITPLLSTNIGARLYYFQNGNYLRIEPRISAAYRLDDALSVRGAFSIGNQFLHLITRNDISLPTDVWFPSTASVKPGEAVQGVLGLESTFADGEYLVTVEGYYKTMRNLLEYTDTASFSLDVPLERSFTSGSGRSYGVEVFINKRVGDLTGWIGYTLAWTLREFPELNRGKEFYPRYDRRHDVSVVLTYRLGETWEFGASWVYGTGQAYTVPTGQYEFDPSGSQGTSPLGFDHRFDYTERNAYRLPAFHKLDLNFTKSFTWFSLPWKFSMNIYNAYSRRNVFAQYLSESDTGEPGVYQFRRITLFPFIPTVGLSVKF